MCGTAHPDCGCSAEAKLSAATVEILKNAPNDFFSSSNIPTGAVTRRLKGLNSGR